MEPPFAREGSVRRTGDYRSDGRYAERACSDCIGRATIYNIALEVKGMYAVIETGGKQYRVENGSVIRVEKLDVPAGEKVIFERVLLAGGEGGVLVGRDVEKIHVEGTVIRHGKAGKIIVFKYRPKKGYHRKSGHRQLFTEVRVEKISGATRGAARKGKGASGKAREKEAEKAAEEMGVAVREEETKEAGKETSEESE